MGEMTIEHADGQWWICVHGNRVAHLGNLSPKATPTEVRGVAEDMLVPMLRAATVIRPGRADPEVLGDMALRLAGEHKVPERRVLHDPMLGVEFTPEMAKRGAVVLAEHERAEEARREPSDTERLSRLTEEHMAALKRFKSWHGRTWKMRLRAAWEAGTLAKVAPRPDDVPLLQQVRNIIGPSGLAAVKL